MPSHSNTKLAVILHADVVGSTELVRSHDELAHERMQKAFRALAKTIESQGGIAREIRGDALVAEFERGSDAIGAALEFQASNRDANSALPDAIRPELRIGIALGEVIVADGTVTGTGVVLAQRLEQLSGPGEVIVQGAVYESVPRRLPFRFSNMGEQRLKGFDEPVRTYGVTPATDSASPRIDSRASSPTRLELPSRPSVAVLAFESLGAEPDQAHFAAGISEDITTELSRFGSIFVVSRQSAFAYRGTDTDVRTIARELGVEYVLEGSVRRSGDRVRVTAQLIDAASGHHEWADRFDRRLEDIFDIQDEITSIVCSTLAGRLQKIGAERAKRKRTENLTAYDYLLRGLELHKSGNVDVDTAKQAVRMFSKAVELDPEFARGHAWLACATSRTWDAITDEHLDVSLSIVQRALQLDPDEAEAHRIIGAVYRYKKAWDKAEFHIRQSLALNPNDAHIAVKAGEFMCYADRPDEAVELIERAMRLNPHHPAWYWQVLGLASYVAGRFDEAIAALRRNLESDILDYAYLIACHVELGDIGNANRYVEDLRALDKNISLEYFTHRIPYVTHRDPDRSARFLQTLAATSLAG